MPTNDDMPPSEPSPDQEVSPPPEEADASSDLPGPLRTSVGALWALLGPPDDDTDEGAADDPGEPDDKDA